MKCPRCKINEKKNNCSYCKNCLVLNSREYRINNLEKCRYSYNKYNRTHKDQRSNYYKKWYAENGRNRAVGWQEAIREWQKNNPEKVKAREKVNNAIRSGKIIKPINCSKCNRETRLSGHHFDYSKPLEVIWLCGSCHKKIHTNLTKSKKLV